MAEKIIKIAQEVLLADTIKDVRGEFIYMDVEKQKKLTLADALLIILNIKTDKVSLSFRLMHKVVDKDTKTLSDLGTEGKGHLLELAKKADEVGMSVYLQGYLMDILK